ncbi:tetratricopeptide repeat protein [Streptomyces huasconensis]|uniref:tetratricopeptide repeat protein n=1 Tax=Streptomyces huasconensis TaxID=1854574 RepID=UPI0036F604D5
MPDRTSRLGSRLRVAVEMAYSGDNPISERRARKAAETGHAKGMTVYGLGLALLGRYDEAHEWLSEAAAAGDPVGRASLATLEVDQGREERALAHLRRGEARFGALGMRIALLQVWTRRTIPFDARALPEGAPDPALEPSPTARVRQIARAGNSTFAWAQLREKLSPHPATDSPQIIPMLLMTRLAERDMEAADAWCVAATEGRREVPAAVGPRRTKQAAEGPAPAPSPVARPYPDEVPAERWARAQQVWDELHELCGGEVTEKAKDAILPSTQRRVSAETAKYLGSRIADKGDLATAQEWFERGAREGDAQAKLYVAEVVRDRFDMARAEPLFREAADAGSAPAMHLYAEHLRLQGQVESAETYFRCAVAAGHQGSLLNLGVLLRKKGDDIGAEECYRKAISTGERANGHNNLANLLHSRGDESAAEHHWRAAAQEGNGAAMASLGTLRAQCGDLEGAERWFRNSAETGDTTGMLNLARTLQLRGETIEADRWLRRVYEADATDMTSAPDLSLDAADIDDWISGPDTTTT